MQILSATYAHIEQISLLYEQFFSYNAGQQPDYYRQASEKGEYAKSVIDNHTEALFVAVENDTVVGLIHITEEKTPPFPCFVPYNYAVIVDLFVVPDCRSKGIGALLLDKARQWAKDRKLSYIELSVLNNNVDGARFYQRENLQDVSRVMRCKL